MASQPKKANSIFAIVKMARNMRSFKLLNRCVGSVLWSGGIGPTVNVDRGREE